MGEYAIGVDLGATNVRVALGDEEGNLIYQLKEKTDTHSGANGVSGQIIRMIRKLQPGKDWVTKLKGIGIGSTGPLSTERGGLLNPTNIPYPFVPMVAPLKEEFGLPTHLMNDCIAAVMGEKVFGAGKNQENLAYITISSGIGGGIYVDNHLLCGKDGNAAEIGHFTIDLEGRLACGCGRRGHWEAYCSGIGIPNYARLLQKENSQIRSGIEESLLTQKLGNKWEKITPEMLYDAAQKNDKISRQIVEKLGILNAIGFASVVDAYDPSLITVGGSIALKNREAVLEPIKRYAKEHARNRIPEISITKLIDDVVIYGALASAFNSTER